MILGMSTSTFTLLHVLISLVGIGTGLIVAFGFLNGKLFSVWNHLFLATTVLTRVTGFLLWGSFLWWFWPSRSPLFTSSIRQGGGAPFA
jgi:hypothetical protein